MKKIAAVLAFVAVYSLPALPQKGSNPFRGRWDLTVTTPGGAHAQWMEIVDMDGKITGRIQPGGGAAGCLWQPHPNTVIASTATKSVR